MTVSTPRRPGAGHIHRCFLARTEAAEGVWASDHFAVVAEVEMCEPPCRAAPYGWIRSRPDASLSRSTHIGEYCLKML